MVTDEQQQAREAIEAVYNDGFAEINGREYHFAKMRHKQRRSVMAFTTAVQDDLQNRNMAFLDSPQFTHIEKIINDHVLFDGMQLSKLPEHWEEYPEDYVMLITTALMVISYPFMRGVNIGSQSQSVAQKKATSKKQI